MDRDKSYFRQLDGLRCIAVLFVLICHWVTYRAVVLVPLGSMGVNLFFVLSGFLITRILLMMRDMEYPLMHSLRIFYVRRTLRIFPIYYLTILFLVIFNFPTVRENALWLLTYTFNHKFALPGVWESDKLHFLVHLWSLSVEEQFYIFFPILVLVVPSNWILRSFIGLIALAVFSRLILFLFQAPPNALYVFTTSCLDSFGVGAILAYLLMYNKPLLTYLLSKKEWFFLALGVYAISIVYSRNFIVGYGECRTVTERLFFSVCCFWLVGWGATECFTGLLGRLLQNKLVVFIGRISYGIYIFHYFTHPFLVKALGVKYAFYDRWIGSYMIPNAIALFLITTTVAAVSWYIIESPINQLKTRVL